MAIACCVCAAVYLALSSGLSLISRDWGGFLPAPLLFQRLLPEAPEQRRGRRKKKKLEEWKVANGEAHRQEVGVISSGSYQSHFLCDLSDETRERERESEAGRWRERWWGWEKADKKCIKETSRAKFTWDPEKEVTAQHERNPSDEQMRNRAFREKERVAYTAGFTGAFSKH